MTPHASAPDPAGAQTINDRQNQPANLELLAAADTAHANSQRWELARGLGACIVALGATAAAFIPGFAPIASLIGAIGAVAQQAITIVSAKHTTTATRLQESFDTGLFALPRAHNTGPAASSEESSALAARYSGPPKRDWYVDVAGLPLAYAVLICQRENLQWDWPLRRRWATYLIIAATGWLLLGIAIALLADWRTRELVLRMWVPSAPAWLLAYVLAYRHRRVATAKQALAITVDEALAILPAVTADDPADPGLCAELHRRCGDYQATIFGLRDYAERVPGLLYRATKTDDEDRARLAARRLRARLLDLPT